jgi:hypothetical protein
MKNDCWTCRFIGVEFVGSNICCMKREGVPLFMYLSYSPEENFITKILRFFVRCKDYEKVDRDCCDEGCKCKCKL